MRFVLLLLVIGALALGWLYKEERTRAEGLLIENSRLQAELAALREKGGGSAGNSSGAAWRQNRVDNWKTPEEAASSPFERRDGAGSNSPSGGNGMNRRKLFDGSGE